ncbi:MAG: DNA translocase FtsK 4TM domain-containing protein [Limisphaerales bacterium]|jgi:S-DNA-T family DNA segregation ATPase FtsK/SpoIIIE
MARRESSESHHNRGYNDIIGISLIAFGLLLMIAQWSYDSCDLRVIHDPPNDPPKNWIGVAGAYLAYYSFRIFGGAAFVLPLLLYFFGLANIWDYLEYLRKRWWSWGAASLLMICSTGILDLYTDKNTLIALAQGNIFNAGFLEKLARNLGIESAGGFLGMVINQSLFLNFGKPGATIIYIALYVISLYLLTNFQLGEWLRELFEKEKFPQSRPDYEKELKEKERELEQKRKELEEEYEKLNAGKRSEKETKAEEKSQQGPLVGPDLQPVPPPRIRDLSIPRIPATEQTSHSIAKEQNPFAVQEEPKEQKVEKENGKQKIHPPAKTAEVLGKVPVSIPTEEQKAESETKTEEIEKEFSGKEAEEKMPTAVQTPADHPGKPKQPQRRTKPLAVASTPVIGNYQLPPLDLLQYPDPTIRPTETEEELLANAQLMKNTLAQFDIEVAIGDITKGPTITRYELHPAPGVKLEKITALSNNIAAALKAEKIHILAPVPGKSSVGVEVPNRIKSKVTIREILESDEWKNTKARIPIALGKDVYGHPIVADLSEMPHLLIAGSTGSGKSVCINSIIASLLYRFAPDQLRFVMIDPKVVELQHYNTLPHLVVPVVTDPKKVILALRWIINEMEKRYQIFAKVGVRNIKSFNERPRGKPTHRSEPELPLRAKKEIIEPNSDGFAVQVDEEIVVPRDEDIVIPDKLSYIVVVIDELADLMLVAPADVEMAIARITQMARAAGIHVIVATQRPSVDVITGIIKANIPARIAFQVASKVDSRTILDAMGADKLLGKGDMLYLPPGAAKLIRAQGALITDQEIQAIVDFISKQGKPSYEMEIHQQLQQASGSFGIDQNGCDEDEDLIQQCIEVIRSEQKASVSLLQRRLRLGYTRAARIMDELERRGIVGPSKGAEPRDILIDLDNTGADGRGQHAV